MILLTSDDCTLTLTIHSTIFDIACSQIFGALLMKRSMYKFMITKGTYDDASIIAHTHTHLSNDSCKCTKCNAMQRKIFSVFFFSNCNVSLVQNVTQKKHWMPCSKMKLKSIRRHWRVKRSSLNYALIALKRDKIQLNDQIKSNVIYGINQMSRKQNETNVLGDRDM